MYIRGIFDLLSLTKENTINRLLSHVSMAKGLTKTQRETERNIAVKASSSQTQGTIVKAYRHLSETNNRLYRQCMDYEMKISLNTGVLDDTNMFKYRFFTLPNTWFVKGAIKYAYDTYMQSHEDELKAGVKFGKWHDFQINEQDPDGTWALSETVLFDGDGYATIGADEVSPDTGITMNDGTTVKNFNLMGAETNQFNIFSEFANLLRYRGAENTSVSSTQPYDGVLDLKDADLMAEVGDQAPYDRRFDSFLHDGTNDQNILVAVDSLTHDGSNAGGRRTTVTFTAPLGLVYVQKFVGDTANAISIQNPELILRFPRGDYKGIRAHSLVV